MNVLEAIHEHRMLNRRVHRLASLLSEVLPSQGSCLDVGCGDGQVAKLIMERLPGLHVEGIDTLARDECCIPVAQYDGVTIPHPDSSFDVVLLVDVVHHADHPERLLRECSRVARNAVVIKDHQLEGLLAGPTLRFMDGVGNRRFSVESPFNFWPRGRWAQVWQDLSLSVGELRTELHIYPWYCTWLFDRQLHFIVRLDKDGDAVTQGSREEAMDGQGREEA